MIKKPELLLPAGSLERLKTAFMYGADAVYAGVPTVSLRNKTSITIEEMKAGIDYAHALGKKVYLTINLFTHNSDIPKLEEFVATLNTLKPDGVIIADPGVFDYVKEHMQDEPPESIIIMTDGYAPFPKEYLLPNVPILWIINNKDVDPPYGRVIRIKSEDEDYDY